MVQITSPLILLAELPKDFQLSDLNLSGKNGERILFNTQKYSDLEVIEAILDGMAFTLTHLTRDETHQNLEIEKLSKIFCKTPRYTVSGIAISLGDNLSGGGHITPVNRALLELGYMIGQDIQAQAIIWVPANQLVGFDYFGEATRQYVDGGPLPILVQVAIKDNEDQSFQTTGLSYFAGQEIFLSAPEEYTSSDTIKRLVRIAHDIATNGRIDNEVETDGLVDGERISFTPDAEKKRVHVKIHGSGTSEID
ncbi:hypothetical protein MNBD_ALPHA04-1722 [hydrothermal vent metagenome]|uniref:Uncharacterized protein n=1 Tax=hydrothermal vent metagenome TaxID=652676 RepID=A0A3B0SKK4_9ZZZZ